MFGSMKSLEKQAQGTAQKDEDVSFDIDSIASSLRVFSYEPIGKVANITVELRHSSSGSGSGSFLIAIEVEDDRGGGLATIGQDEVAGVLQGMRAVLSLNNNPTKLKFFEFSYTSKEELKIVVFNREDGTFNYSLKGGSSGPSVYMTPKNLEQIMRLINAANVRLVQLNS